MQWLLPEYAGTVLLLPHLQGGTLESRTPLFSLYRMLIRVIACLKQALRIILLFLNVTKST
ncbi:hypothetical protein T4D_13217 [Trichinella pseudospiralis]|uniref:Uncharacterized protein n=1 Tax=Trichinella pseudospiralis TaxID=6337 RepID=A0A0V1FAG4_TRIPS|nr:hypothetical protein T4D_13217 [Trichinella pseudospiralis]